ncbi:hypothetical protein CKF54_00510 [Psittacicella hinzii]|uniref:Uncharacterized protein n=1 Tax=Psittacicella hinzii TaxID=2028575 RepID=A0A3A1Y8J5_9GAMM|nr:hypothetical protein CKF54_00510 [Psittacicella hinzii]
MESRCKGFKTEFKRMQSVGIEFIYVRNGKIIYNPVAAIFKDEDILEIIPVYTASFLGKIWKGVKNLFKGVVNVFKSILGLKKKGTDSTTQPNDDDGEGKDAFTNSMKNDSEGKTIPMVYGLVKVGSIVVQKSLISQVITKPLSEETDAETALLKRINTGRTEEEMITYEDLVHAHENQVDFATLTAMEQERAKLRQQRNNDIDEKYQDYRIDVTEYRDQDVINASRRYNVSDFEFAELSKVTNRIHTKINNNGYYNRTVETEHYYVIVYTLHERHRDETVERSGNTIRLSRYYLYPIRDLVKTKLAFEDLSDEATYKKVLAYIEMAIAQVYYLIDQDGKSGKTFEQAKKEYVKLGGTL